MCENASLQRHSAADRYVVHSLHEQSPFAHGRMDMGANVGGRAVDGGNDTVQSAERLNEARYDPLELEE